MVLLAGTTVAVSPSHSHMSGLADIPSPIVSGLGPGHTTQTTTRTATQKDGGS